MGRKTVTRKMEHDTNPKYPEYQSLRLALPWLKTKSLRNGSSRLRCSKNLNKKNKLLAALVQGSIVRLGIGKSGEDVAYV